MILNPVKMYKIMSRVIDMAYKLLLCKYLLCNIKRNNINNKVFQVPTKLIT